jgi:hypothetical protein
VCGEKRAVRWFYDQLDPNEKVDKQGRRYSTDLDHYLPLCMRCSVKRENQK